jgi:hypothetical protein
MEVVINKNKQELERLEGIIRENIGAFYEIGDALMNIRENKYYHDVLGYETFEEYCRKRWDYKRTYTFYLIESAKVMNNVHDCEQKPTNEWQVRPLVKIKDPEVQLTAWQKAVETAPDGKITAAHVYKIVKGMMTEPKNKEVLPGLATEARQLVNLAISQLDRIRDDDPRREKEFDRVLMWIKLNRKGGKV